MNFYQKVDEAIKEYDKNLKLILPSTTDSRYFITKEGIKRTSSQYFMFEDNSTNNITTARFEIIPKGAWNEDGTDEGLKLNLLEIYNKWNSFQGFGKAKKIVRKYGIKPLYQSLNVQTMDYEHIYFKAPEGSVESIWRFDHEKWDRLYYYFSLDKEPVCWDILYDILNCSKVDMVMDFLRDYRSKYPDKKLKYLYFYSKPDEMIKINEFLMGTAIGDTKPPLPSTIAPEKH
jgi:hypothetical protein